MHKPEFIAIINEAAENLGIETKHFSDNWAIEVRRHGIVKHIIGYTFPLNDAACYKIARNKNLCSEILAIHGVSSIPHQLLYSHQVLERRRSQKGNREAIGRFVERYGFPIVVKRNNSSGGEGVFLATNEPALEMAIAEIFSSDSTLCLSPFRKNMREYRNVILQGRCLLSYEKIRPTIVGDGTKRIFELLQEFQASNNSITSKREFLFDPNSFSGLDEVLGHGEKRFLQWKHNASYGASCIKVDDTFMQDMAVKAAKAIGADFVSVDIAHTEEFGLEVLEINASVVMHLYASMSDENRQQAVGIYCAALKAAFTEMLEG